MKGHHQSPNKTPSANDRCGSCPRLPTATCSHLLTPCLGHKCLRQHGGGGPRPQHHRDGGGGEESIRSQSNKAPGGAGASLSPKRSTCLAEKQIRNGVTHTCRRDNELHEPAALSKRPRNPFNELILDCKRTASKNSSLAASEKLVQSSAVGNKGKCFQWRPTTLPTTVGRIEVRYEVRYAAARFPQHTHGTSLVMWHPKRQSSAD